VPNIQPCVTVKKSTDLGFTFNGVIVRFNVDAAASGNEGDIDATMLATSDKTEMRTAGRIRFMTQY
jgi:hypothetical protein